MNEKELENRHPEGPLAPPGFTQSSTVLPDEILRRATINITPPESPEDAAHRRQSESTELKFRHKLLWLLIWIVAAAVSVALASCLWLVIEGDADSRKLALTTHQSIISALIGVLAGAGGAKLLGGEGKSD